MGRILRCASALFFLFLSYYLVKPLRNSQFLAEFGPSALPLVYLVVSVTSVSVTRVFQWASLHFSRRQVVAGTFLWAIGCKVFFFLTLRQGGQAVTALFYLWASVYFLLLVSTLWGCLNERFRMDQCQRCFPFIALGSTIGNIAGASLAEGMKGAGPSSLLCAALACLFSLLLLWRELAYPVQMQEKTATRDKPAVGFGWLRDRSLRAIAVMVLALAVYSTSTDFITQRRLDVSIGQAVYAQELAPLWPGGYEQISALRNLPSARQEPALRELARGQQLDAEQLVAGYGRYKREFGSRLSGVFASIFQYQGLLGVLILGVLCRPFLRRFGLSAALVVMPTFALCATIVLMFPLDVLWVQLILVLSGSLNYSFNNAAKEMLYTGTDREAILQAKPFIEGPLMRLGDVFCSLLTILSGLVVARLGWAKSWEEWLIVLPCALALICWWVLVRRAGSTTRGAPSPTPES
ncbi:MAG: hypothetical protein KF760_02105 [Candidatus Eremiobacteraeota bacterium]|nr:hypothetical protein [Candidatus Eremiobacteraeota bacterium]MCW5870671.1 hypothetical protein [Candidatus Eremiobacteraeota bacterium]